MKRVTATPVCKVATHCASWTFVDAVDNVALQVRRCKRVRKSRSEVSQSASKMTDISWRVWRAAVNILTDRTTYRNPAIQCLITVFTSLCRTLLQRVLLIFE